MIHLYYQRIFSNSSGCSSPLEYCFAITKININIRKLVMAFIGIVVAETFVPVIQLITSYQLSNITTVKSDPSSTRNCFGTGVNKSHMQMIRGGVILQRKHVC